MEILLAHEVSERLPHGGGGERASGCPHRQGPSAGRLRPAFRVTGRPFLRGAATTPLRSSPPRRRHRAPSSARRPQHGPPASAPLLRHLRGAAARRGGGSRRLRQELGPAGGRGARDRLLSGRRAPARRQPGGEGPAAGHGGKTNPSRPVFCVAEPAI